VPAGLRQTERVSDSETCVDLSLPGG
jgi:hypothetical protein